MQKTYYKTTAELTPEELAERREETRIKVAAHRERKADAARIPTCDGWLEEFPIKHPENAEYLNTETAQLTQKIQGELGRELRLFQENYAVDIVLRSLISYNKGYLRKVTEPDGTIVGGMYFMDAIGREIMDAVHQFQLEKSSLFSKLYRELLAIIRNRNERFTIGLVGFRGDCDYDAITAELGGTYVYVLQAAIPPSSEYRRYQRNTPFPPEPESAVQEHRPQQNPYLSTEARKILDGG